MTTKNNELQQLKEDIAKIAQMMVGKGYWLCLSDKQADDLKDIVKRNHVG